MVCLSYGFVLFMCFAFLMSSIMCVSEFVGVWVLWFDVIYGVLWCSGFGVLMWFVLCLV
jgi:hypothetical protein